MEKDTLVVVQKKVNFFPKMIKYSSLLILGTAWWVLPIEDMCVPKWILDARKKRVEARRERWHKEAEERRERERRRELKRVYNGYQKKEQNEQNAWREKEMEEYIEKRKAREAEAQAARRMRTENEEKGKVVGN